MNPAVKDCVMIIKTSRFGEVEVDDNRVIRFERGVLGFPKYKDYVLIDGGEESYFWWLQSVEVADLAFVVTDPSLFVPTYRVPIRPEQMTELGISTLEQAQVFVIVNKRGTTLTGNLQGPLVVNVQSREAQQLVLSDRRFTTRVPLIEVGQPTTSSPAQLQAASA
ncbi:MAG: flagellar assembly protein FliW [Planctomycetota bacterium]